jgi:hypothetical protein
VPAGRTDSDALRGNYSPHQKTPNTHQSYHSIGSGSFIHDPPESQVFQPTDVENALGSSNMDIFQPQGFVVDYTADSHQSSHGPISAGEPFSPLVQPSLLEEPAREEDFSTLFSPGMSQTFNPRTTIPAFDTDSWDDLGSSSNQPPSRDSSSGSLDWEIEEVSVPRRQSSSGQSQSSPELVLEQLVDLNVPSSGQLWQSNQRQHGRFESESKRQETCSTRKRGACLRCKMQRLRVNSRTWSNWSSRHLLISEVLAQSRRSGWKLSNLRRVLPTIETDYTHIALSPLQTYRKHTFPYRAAVCSA